METKQKPNIDAVIQEIENTNKELIKDRTNKIVKKAIKKRKKISKGRGNSRIKLSINSVDTIKKKLIRNDTLAGKPINMSSIVNGKPQKELLQKILRNHNIDENAVAEALISLKDDPDFRARDAFIDKTVKYLGYEFKETAEQQTTNNIVIMPSDIIKKYRKDANIDALDGELEIE